MQPYNCKSVCCGVVSYKNYVYIFFHPLVLIICNVDHNKIEYSLGIRMIHEYLVDMKAFSFIFG